MKIIIFLLLIIFSSAVEFNTNSIISIYDDNGNGVCPGVIIADKYVISGNYCDTKNKPSYIIYKENYYPIIAYKKFNGIVLFKTSMMFESKDFVAISPYNQIFLKELPESYKTIHCDKNIEINYFNIEFDEDSNLFVTKQFIEPIDNYLYRNDKILINYLTKYQQRISSDRSKKIILSTVRSEHEKKISADKFFLWRKCFGKYTLEGIYNSRDKFVNLTHFHNGIFDNIISLSYSDKGSLSALVEHHDIDMLKSILFVDIPILSDGNVNAYLDRMIHEDWIEIDGKRYKIPFKSSKVTNNPCGTKLDLMTLFLYKFPDPNIKFVKIFLKCRDNYNCFKILGRSFNDHITLGYRSLESNKIMIVDPAVSDEAFPLSYESFYSKGLFYPIIDRDNILKNLSYLVSVANVGFTRLIWWSQQEVNVNDEVYRKVIDSNKYCIEEGYTSSD